VHKRQADAGIARDAAVVQASDTIDAQDAAAVATVATVAAAGTEKHAVAEVRSACSSDIDEAASS
jgi:hypothetical protein